MKGEEVFETGKRTFRRYLSVVCPHLQYVARVSYDHIHMVALSFLLSTHVKIL